jgi:hypothetical protein
VDLSLGLKAGFKTVAECQTATEQETLLVISGFRRDVDHLPTFRDNVSVPSSKAQEVQEVLTLGRWDRYVDPKRQ